MTPSQRPRVGGCKILGSGAVTRMEHAINDAISAAMLLFVTSIASVVLAPASREVIEYEQAAKEQEGHK